MVLISIRFMARKDGPAGVSVPLRGLWFLSPYALWLEKTGQLVFPSPCGDYGSYHGGGNVDKTKDPCKFPSPCGDYGSYLAARAGLTLDKYIDVSVPLRGLWFLSDNELLTAQKYLCTVSVPLRGLWFLSLREEKVMRKYEIVSVPLRGLWFLSAGRPRR